EGVQRGKGIEVDLLAGTLLLRLDDAMLFAERARVGRRKRAVPTRAPRRPPYRLHHELTPLTTPRPWFDMPRPRKRLPINALEDQWMDGLERIEVIRKPPRKQPEEPDTGLCRDLAVADRTVD